MTPTRIVTPESPSRRYYLIDLLRAFAALAVLLWHFQIFAHFNQATQSIEVDRTGLPLLTLASPFYYHGHWAVQLFWAISGFVFYATYAERGASTTAWTFFVHRFARLYPLHFATLLIVAALQIISTMKLNTYQVYPHNDLKHFLLQMMMASHWGFQKGFSFNGPIWSVSVEVLIYAVFLVVMAYASRNSRTQIVVTLALAFVGFLTRRHFIGQCLFYFFCGGSAWILHKRLQYEWRRWEKPALAAASAIALAANALLQNFQPNWQSHISFALAFCAAILVLAYVETIFRPSGLRILQPVGDLTYGIYLWHMPIVIGILIVTEIMGISRAFANSVWFLLAFLVTVIVTARAGFLYLEQPAGAAIKRRWLN